MLIKMRPTDEIVLLDGVPCRRWIGRTDKGTDCDVYVHRVRVEAGKSAEFDEALRNVPDPNATEKRSV